MEVAVEKERAGRAFASDPHFAPAFDACRDCAREKSSESGARKSHWIDL
jgi:hypothetical protein